MAEGVPLRVLLLGGGSGIEAIEASLAGGPFEVRRGSDGDEVVRLSASRGIDLVVLPENLPPDGGIALCRRLRQNAALLALPIVLVLDRDDEAAKRASIAAGADEYLAPPFPQGEVRTRLVLAFSRADRTVMVNPLTGLPGNQEINRRVERRIARREAFAACYVDLDNFKSFNDHYGFEQGDQVILLLARILSEAVRELGAPDDFVGHIGGDDFLLLTHPDHVPALSTRIIGRFDREIGDYYRKEDLQRGYILTWDRTGNIQETPVMTLSIAVATNRHREIKHIGEVGAILADLKQYVKLLPGSNCVVDRRTDSTGATPDLQIARDEAWRQLILTDQRPLPGARTDTSVPAITEVIEPVTALVRQTGRLATVCLSVTSFTGDGETPVWTEVPTLTARIGKILLAQRGRSFRTQDFIVTSPVHEGAVFLILTPPRGAGTGRLDELERVADRVRAALLAELVAELGRFEIQRFQIQCGASLIHQKGGPFPRLIYQGMDAALRSAARRGRRDRGQRAAALRRLVEAVQIRTLLQPIVHLKNGQVVGYEALSRGPKGSDLEAPTQLFVLARTADLVWTLERLCHRIAMSHAAQFPADARLFLNCDPELAHDPEFRRLSAADYSALAGRPMVLEIHEEALARRLGLVRSAVATFRAQGFEIGVDHASTEFRVLGPLAELRPDFLKFDVSLIRGIDREVARRELLAAMVRFAKRIGASTVAAGVETEDELGALRQLGLEYGQGNFFSAGIE